MPKLTSRFRRLVLLSCLLWPLAGLARPAAAAPASGSIISYQGLLSTAAGAPVADGTQSLTFRIYEDGTAVFSQTAPVLTVNGVFNTFLSVGALTFDPAHGYELGITFNGVEARHPIAAVPLAINATNANNAAIATNFLGALSGDVTGTQGATTVAKIRGQAVAATAPTGGQVLTYNGGTNQYEPTTPAATVQSDGTTLTGDGSAGNKLAVKVPLALSGSSASPIVSGTNTGTGGAGAFNINNAGNTGDALTASTNGTGNAIAATGKITASGDINTATQYNLGGSAVLATGDPANNNLFGGLGAGNPSTTGTNNAFFGPNAGNANTIGTGNAFVGSGAGQNNTSGGGSVFVGAGAGQHNTTGANNAFLGFQAGLNNTTGGGNAFVGFLAGNGNTTANDNAFLGVGAGQSVTVGGENTFIGTAAGGSNTTGTSNTFVGTHSGLVMDGGSNNIALGQYAGSGLTTGDNNIDIFDVGVAGEANTIRLGSQGTQTATYIAGISGNTGVTGLPVVVDSNGQLGTSTTVAGTVQSDGTTITGDGSTTPLAIKAGGIGQTQVANGGYVDLTTAQTVGGAKTFTSPVNTSSQYNIGGNNVLNLTGGANSVAVGVGAGANNTGGNNTFLGTNAGVSNGTGNGNTFLGLNAGYSNTTGGNNAFVGLQAGQTNTTGSNNAFIGQNAGISNTTGVDNAFVGTAAGAVNATGSLNAFFGTNAGVNNTTGGGNVAVGYAAGQNLTTGNYNIDIFDAGVAGEANTIRLGSQGTQTAAYIAGISGTALTGSPVVVTSSGQLGTGTPGQYGYIYNLGAQTVAIEAAITFDTNGPLAGITHAPGNAGMVCTNAGVYKVNFIVSSVEPGQFALFINGAPVAGSLYGSGAGTQQNNGQTIVTLAAGDVLTLVNHSSAAATTLQTLAGGTQTNVNASLLIQKID